MNAKPRSILVVDDDSDARLIMRAALRKAGFDVRLATGGADALRQFDAHSADMVMLDVDMPDISGHEVCAQLRARAGVLLPIVMVTGMDDVQSVETAYDHGATDFIVKPVNWALLGHRVRYVFRSSEAMRALHEAEARHAAVLQAIPDLLFEVDVEGRYLALRAPREDLLVAPAAQLIGKSVRDVLPPHAADVCMQQLHVALAEGRSSGGQYELDLPRGKTWFELSMSRKSATPGEPPRFIVLSRDITDRKDAEARIARLAYYDSLTGLPNRRAFLGRVDREIARAARSGQRLAVLFMDLDGFKGINDTLGHAAGDLVLQWAAERLRDGLRPSDILSRPMDLDGDQGEEVALARLGGDEFTALLLDVASPEDAVSVAHRIGASMRRPFILDGREVNLTTSTGIAMYPEDGTDGATLLKHADTAMYHAKTSGRDNAQAYRESLTDELMQRLELENALRGALDRGELRLVYQPQVDATTGRVSAMEALLRWKHPQRGDVGPLRFIPLAEANGTIEAIGEWVLRQACADAAAWRAAGDDVAVAVNLSPLQLASPTFAETVTRALRATGLRPERLELEITEGVVMEHNATSVATLSALRDAGVRIAIDDFGTGYSSLSYLSRMPIHHIKIDRSFVTQLLQSTESQAIIRAVLAIASSLRLRVTAEGVETPEQFAALVAMDCRFCQGYYFSRPVEAGEVRAILRRRWSMVEPIAAAGPFRVDRKSAA